VGLGTDGQSTNNGQSLWETMKYAMFAQKGRFGAQWGSAELALELATIGGARAIGMEDRIGSLQAGKQADLILVDLWAPQFQPRSTWPSNLVYANLPSAVDTVLVAGSVLVEGGRLRAWDADEIIAGANRASAEMESRTGLGAKYRARSRWSWVEG
jgi:5-methylthioadenosine/S-adenosylhomocysteine deaminase